MSIANSKYFPCLKSNLSSQTPNKHNYSSLRLQKASVNQDNSLSYSHTNKNTHKYISYDSETGPDLARFTSQQGNIIEQLLQPKYEAKIGEDLDRLNSKLELLENCFLNMSTINQEDKQNIRPGMLKKSNKNSRHGSKQAFVTKRSSLIDNHKNSYQSSKRVSRRGSFLYEPSEIKQVSKQKQISQLKKEVSFCQKSLSASRHKKQILERKVQDCNQKIKNYKILQRKSKKLEVDYAKLLRTLQKSQQVRLKQKSLISKYEVQIKRLNKIVKVQK